MPSSLMEARGATRLVEDHYLRIRRYLRFLGCPAPLAEDLAQETFVAVLDRPPRLEDPEALAVYLRSIARNLFLKSLRKTKSEPAWVDLGRADAVWEKVARPEDWDAYRRALRGCVDGLSDRDREVLEAYYRRESGRRDLAAAFGLSEEGLKSLLRRIKEVLKACVKGKLSHG